MDCTTYVLCLVPKGDAVQNHNRASIWPSWEELVYESPLVITSRSSQHGLRSLA